MKQKIEYAIWGEKNGVENIIKINGTKRKSIWRLK